MLIDKELSEDLDKRRLQDLLAQEKSMVDEYREKVPRL